MPLRPHTAAKMDYTPLNRQIELRSKATSFLGIGSYGELTVGSGGIEYVSDANKRDYIQIPWAEVDRVSAPVMFKGRYLPRFTVMTRASGEFAFSTRDNKRTLRAIREHIGAERLVRAPSMSSSIAGGIKGLVSRLVGRHGDMPQR
ncbi:PF06115 domain protein [Olsenella profusa F0195]|uniref:PF06115 domain protein n=2 Tax=Olsenella profusa TaxID=138595 RepID=U2VD35_9ACTN|nr:PF06115 domain protein [Olsenella profusa F0195]